MSCTGERKRRGNDVGTLTTTSADDSTVRALDEGQGPVILILHPGMETGTRYRKVAAILSKRFRVIRLHRRQYRLDLKKDPRVGSPCTVAEEVEHVLAMVKRSADRWSFAATHRVARSRSRLWSRRRPGSPAR
jgi:hypothetical protein